MKLLRQILDRQNPRSLWHRPCCTECQGWFVETCTVLIGLLGAGFSLLAMMWFIHLIIEVLIPAVCNVVVFVGLDDSTHILYNISHTSSGLFGNWYTLIEVETVLLALIALLPLLVIPVLLLESAWGHMLNALLLQFIICIGVIRLPFLTALVLPVFPGVATGMVGPGIEFLKFVSSPSKSTGETPWVIVRDVMGIITDPSSGFYTATAACGLLIGVTLGIVITASILCLWPLHHCYKRIVKDVRDTIHDCEV
jgi:hypothetical protein